MSNQEDDTNNNLLNQAISYQERGWSVIPVGADKKPLISWKQYQQERATKEAIAKWFTVDYPSANVGIVTGKISDIIAIDIDPRHDGTNEAFKDILTVRAKTGGGGEHILFKFEEGISNKTGMKPGIDLRAEGGYIIVPPSKHQSGNMYEWIQGPESTELAPLPVFVKDWIKDIPSNQLKNISYNGVAEGSRNDSAASVAGSLLHGLPLDQWDSVAWPLLTGWNTQNKPPLEEAELRTVFESIKQREVKSIEEEKETIAAQVIKSLIDENNELFHDQHKESYIRLINQDYKILKIRSKAFKKWISHYIWLKFKKLLPTDKLSSIIQVLEGNAMYDGKEYSLSVRVTRKEDEIWYQLSESRFIKINSLGWEVIKNPPILFKKFTHQKDQVTPQENGTINDLCRFVNLKTDDEKLLFQVYTIASFIPGFPHPLLVLFGSQGAGKTTPLRVLKSLIDPSELRTLSAPDVEREFVQMASHHYFFFLDNLSSMPGWLSDALARASTGDGFVKRELYSDDDDVIYSFQRSIGLNGINLVVQKADLLDRSILLPLNRIPKEKRKEESLFWKDFDEVKPALLGAIFTALVGALREYKNIKLSGYPRMADFARWGCAIARAIGYSEQDFMDAYNANISSQSDAAIDASPVGTALVEFMDQKEEWNGTAAELLTILEDIAGKLKINVKAKDWPKDPSWLVRRLQLIIPNLLDNNITVYRDETARPKVMQIKKIPKNDVTADVEQQEGVNLPDGKIIEPTPIDGENIAIEQSSSASSALSVNTDKVVISRIKKREECPEMTDIEYEIYLDKEWKIVEREKQLGLY